MNLKDKTSLGMIQAIILTIAGLIIVISPYTMVFRMLPSWFGWILVALGVSGFFLNLWRYRKTRDPWL